MLRDSMTPSENTAMQTLRKLFIGILAIIALQGCDLIAMRELKPGVSTVADVRDWFGAPGQEWRNDDGSTVLEYSRQPAGTECFMITIGPDGILRSIDQVLVETNFARIRTGMSSDEVRRILGKPASRKTFDLKPETVWEWHIGQDNPMSDPTFFTVTFDNAGRVTGTGRHTVGRNR